MTTQPQTRFSRPRDKGEGRERYAPKRKSCFFCVNASKLIDYKDPAKLREYISNRAKIDPRRRSGVCAKHQRRLAVAIKRARHLALLPFAPSHLYQTGSIATKQL